MGRVEQEARKMKVRRNIQNAVLATVGVTGILAVAMVAPNVFQALPRLGGDKYKLAFRTRNAIGRLAAKGLIRFTTNGGTRRIEITNKGRKVLAFAEAKNTHSHKRTRWDKRFRLVMFDVPEKRRVIRNRLRAYMREFGFLRLQDSVWIYPYECEEIIALLKAELQIGRNILYAVVESIENDEWIKKHFELRA